MDKYLEVCGFALFYAAASALLYGDKVVHDICVIQETEVGISWLLHLPLVVGNQSFTGHAASIFRVKVCDQGKTGNYASGTFVGRQQFSGHISLITNFNTEDGGSTDSETLVSNYETARCRNP
jgi:hypothetical protein